MKKIMLAILVVLLILAFLGAAGFLLYRHFVTNQITDWGGMENPDAASENEQLLDGGGTYAANDVLLEHIAGEWKSADGRFEMAIGEDYGIEIILDGETALRGFLEFTYLMPEEAGNTELRLQSGDYALRGADGDEIYAISSFEYEFSENNGYGKILMELSDGEQTKAAEFTHQ